MVDLKKELLRWEISTWKPTGKKRLKILLKKTTPPPPPPDEIVIVEDEEEIENEIEIEDTESDEDLEIEEEEETTDEVFMIVEDMPRFKGCTDDQCTQRKL